MPVELISNECRGSTANVGLVTYSPGSMGAVTRPACFGQGNTLGTRGQACVLGAVSAVGALSALSTFVRRRGAQPGPQAQAAGGAC